MGALETGGRPMSTNQLETALERLERLRTLKALRKELIELERLLERERLFSYPGMTPSLQRFCGSELCLEHGDHEHTRGSPACERWPT